MLKPTRHRATATALTIAVAATASVVQAQTQPPGVVIDYSPASSGRYIGSPSITILSDGAYVASHDFFGTGANDVAAPISSIFRSIDRGQTWTKSSDITGAFWGSLFTRGNELFHLGVSSSAAGNLLIRRSTNGGVTWSGPATSATGLLKTKTTANGGFHQAPTPVIVANGRIWHGVEDMGNGGGWPAQFRSMVMSAPVGADLLNSANWTFTNPVARPAGWGSGGLPNGFLEGNAVVDRGGNIVNLLRVDNVDKAAVMRVTGTSSLSFDPVNDLVDLPGGPSKFHIQYDAQSDRYWALSNPALPGFPSGGATRNGLAVVSSPDLKEWRVEHIELFHPDATKHAFQYPSWTFDGADIVAVSRTAYDDNSTGAANYHDANYLTFHRITDFRSHTSTPINTYLIAGNDRVAGQFDLVGGAGGPWVLNPKRTISGDVDGNPATPALANVWGLTQDNRGRVYVSEQRDGGRITQFDSAYKYLATLTTEGSEFVGRPEAMTLGPDGNIYFSVAFGTVSDRIYKLDTKTNAVTRFDNGVTLNNPRGLAFASDGNLYVADRQNNAVRIFDGITGKFLRDLPNVGASPQALSWDGENERLLISTTAPNGAIVAQTLDGTRTVLYQHNAANAFLDVDFIDGAVHFSDYAAKGTYRIVDGTTRVAVTGGQDGHLLRPLRIQGWDGGSNSSASMTDATNWIGDSAPAFNSGDLLELRGSTRLTPTLNSAVTVGGLNVAADGGAFTIAGSGGLRFAQVGRGIVNLSPNLLRIDVPLTFTAQPIDAASGSIEVSRAITVSGMLVLAGSGEVRLSDAISGKGRIVKIGTGTASLAGANDGLTGSITVLGGTLRLTHHAAAGTGGIVVADGAAARLDVRPADAVVVRSLSLQPASRFDLADGVLAIDYPAAASPLADIKLAIGDGRIFSTSNRSGYALAVATASELGITSFGRSTFDGSTLLVRLTRAGDASLDGVVDFNDLVRLAQHYGRSTGATWASGDFDGNAATEFADLVILAQNYGSAASLSGDPPITNAIVAADWALAQSLVPEPGLVSLLAVLFYYGRRSSRA